VYVYNLLILSRLQEEFITREGKNPFFFGNIMNCAHIEQIVKPFKNKRYKENKWYVGNCIAFSNRTLLGESRF